MKVLAIDSTAVSAGAAIVENGKLVGESFTNVGLTHSQTLMPMVESLLKNTDTDINSVDVFAVAAGPGSFTGIRIGVAAIKGMADAVKKPCMAVSALEEIAYPFRYFDGIVCAAMDARCNQVYTALFYHGERLTADTAMQVDILGEDLKKRNLPVLFAGDGAALCVRNLESVLPKLQKATAQTEFQKASSAAFLAWERLESGEAPIPAADLLPVYLRLPQAERELNNKKRGNLK